MKTHIRSFSIGGLLVPLALALATLIGNESQMLLGLHLDHVALAIFLFPFLAGAAAAYAALLRWEAAKIGGDLGNVIGDLASSLFQAPVPAEPPPGPPQTPKAPSALITPPPEQTSPPPPPPPVPPAPAP